MSEVERPKVPQWTARPESDGTKWILELDGLPRGTLILSSDFSPDYRADLARNAELGLNHLLLFPARDQEMNRRMLELEEQAKGVQLALKRLADFQNILIYGRQSPPPAATHFAYDPSTRQGIPFPTMQQPPFAPPPQPMQRENAVIAAADTSRPTTCCMCRKAATFTVDGKPCCSEHGYPYPDLIRGSQPYSPAPGRKPDICALPGCPFAASVTLFFDTRGQANYCRWHAETP